jgi:hypothetical protein
MEVLMPMGLLNDLAIRDLPCRVLNAVEIDKLAVLRTEELVAAFIPSFKRLPTGERVYEPAIATAVTAKGRKALGM